MQWWMTVPAAVVVVATVVLVVILSRRHRPGEAVDELDDSTASLLALLGESVVVVDSSDEVVLASPSSYCFGVVADDAVVDSRIAEAVGKARRGGHRVRFDLTTSTPERFREDAESMGGGSVVGDAGDDGSDVSGVSRPNWLKVTVGPIGRGFVVVLLDDVSERMRFMQTRDSFIENVSAQLLEPTRSMERLASSLESGHGDETDLRRAASRTRRLARHMDRLVNDLLLLIRAQEPVDAAESNRLALDVPVRAARDDCALEAKERGVALRLTADRVVMVHGDGPQIRVAVGRMIDNAIRYSPDGASIDVTVGTSTAGDRAVVRVIDRGAGISREERPRVFERFFRGSNQSARTADGVGLGLAIVKHVALTHHGGVSVWSAPGQGSTFTLSLPLADGDP